MEWSIPEVTRAVPNLDEWTYCSVSVESRHLGLPLYGSSETGILHQPEHYVLQPELRTVCQTWMNGNTVESACNEHGYNKFPPITKSFSGTDFFLVVFNIKKYGYNEFGYSEITLITKPISPPKVTNLPAITKWQWTYRDGPRQN